MPEGAGRTAHADVAGRVYTDDSAVIKGKEKIKTKRNTK